MSTLKQFTTAEELLNMPTDGFRYELFQGEMRKMSPAGYRHGKIAMKLGASLYVYASSKQLGEVFAAETGFKLSSSPDTVLAPDVAFVQKERVPEVAVIKGFGSGVPDLVAEVTSPSDTYQEVEDKVDAWLNAGAKMVLILNPRKKTVAVHRSKKDVTILNEEDEIDGQDVILGWKVKVADLFL